MRAFAIYKAFSRNRFTAFKLILLCILTWRKDFEIYSYLLSVFSKICNENATLCRITLTQTSRLYLLNINRVLNFYFIFLKGKQIIFYAKGCNAITCKAIRHFEGNGSFAIFICNQNRLKESCRAEIFSFFFFFIISCITTHEILYAVSYRIHKQCTGISTINAKREFILGIEKINWIWNMIIYKIQNSPVYSHCSKLSTCIRLSTFCCRKLNCCRITRSVAWFITFNCN